MRLLIAIVVWIGAIVGAAEVSSVVASSIHHTKGTSTADPSSVTGTDSASLFRTANFSRALASARRDLGPGTRVETFALYPGYLSLTASKGGSEVVYYVNVNGQVMRSTGGSVGPLSAFSLSKVHEDTPARLARRIARAAHVPTSQLHYMVAEVDPITHKLQWLVYTIQGNPVEYFQASGPSGQLLELRANGSSGLQPVPR